MVLTKNYTTTPFHGRSNGGTNLRNLRRHGSILRGTKSAVWSFGMPLHSLELGSTANLTGIAEGAMIFDDGTSGTAWNTAFPGVACSVTMDSHTTSINSEIVVRIAGYDQFDRLVEEEVAVAAADRTGLSRAAYSEVIQCELVSKGSSEPSDFDVSIIGISDHSGFSPGLTGTTIPGTYIGLPFMADRYDLIQAVISAQTSASGYLRNLNTKNSDGVGLWSLQSESGSVTDSVLMLDTDVQRLGAGTMLLPGFSNSAGAASGCVMFDPSIADMTI
jgi:hypothetical protein